MSTASATSTRQCDAATSSASPRDDFDALVRVLRDAVSVVESEGIPYAVIGGVASSALGRPRVTRDIDLLVEPCNALRTLRAFGARSFDTEETDSRWIYKAFRESIQVDIIFYTVGGTYLDATLLEHSIRGTFSGVTVQLVSPEDLLIIKAVAHDEASPRHWHDALGILASNDLDWEYLVHRSRRASRRVLSLLLYAQSLDIHVPDDTIRKLFERVYRS